MSPRSQALFTSGRHIVFFTVTALLAQAAPAAGSPAACEALAKAGAFSATTVSAARVVPADPVKHLPGFCEMTASVKPVAGSNITVVYRLPDNWNGKLLGIGGGGWAGDVALVNPLATLTSAEGLANGYATAQTNGGHEVARRAPVPEDIERPGPDGKVANRWDTSWAANPEAAADFSYRAIHVMTEIGKQVIASYYGKPHKRAYFQGCSTGGRQALMEVQRFPGDYDGVIAGAPVYTLTTQTMSVVRNQILSRKGAALTAAQLERLNAAALAACDGADGLVDGIVTDPRACQFDPGPLQCGAGKSDDACLTSSQLVAVRALYAGTRTSSGETVSYGLTRGSEAGWSRFISTSKPADRANFLTGPAGAGLGGLRAQLFGEPDFDLASFDPERDYRTVRNSAFAAEYEAKDPDIRAFVKAGGKLLLWHGMDDPGPNVVATVEYYERMKAVTGTKVASLDSSARFFVLPGVYHCRGGPGADKFDALTALDRWVERSEPPTTMVATRSSDGALSRPVCPYPTLPRYKGEGDPRLTESFNCK